VIGKELIDKVIGEAEKIGVSPEIEFTVIRDKAASTTTVSGQFVDLSQRDLAVLHYFARRA
jgi:hypothetical protein